MLINVWRTTSFELHSKESNQKWHKITQTRQLIEWTVLHFFLFPAFYQRWTDSKRQKKFFALLLDSLPPFWNNYFWFSYLATLLITFISALVNDSFLFCLSLRIFLNICNVFKNQINKKIKILNKKSKANLPVLTDIFWAINLPPTTASPVHKPCPNVPPIITATTFCQ